MVWNSFGEFVSMGGYGQFVWGSVAVSVVSMTLEVVALSMRKGAIAGQLSASLMLNHALVDQPVPELCAKGQADTDKGGST